MSHLNTALVPLLQKEDWKAGKVQRKTSKFILKTEDSYDTLLKKLNLLSLDNERLLADVTFWYTALHRIIILRSNLIEVQTYVYFYSSADRYSFRQYVDFMLQEDI